MKSSFIKVIESLELNDADCIYLQFSSKDLDCNFSEAKKLLDIFIEIFKDKSIFMPTYPFGPSAEYRKLISQESLTFDSILTPCRLNLMGELFRRKKNAIRSMNPILPFSGLGSLAEEILNTAHLDELPFDSNTPFSLLTKYKTYVVGIGVNIHINSFMHLIDDRKRNLFPYKLYSEIPIKAKIFNNKKFIHTGYYHYILPEIRSKMHFEKIHDIIKNEKFYKYVTSSFNAYSIELNEFLKVGEKMADDAFKFGDLPVWHKPLTNN